MGNPSGRRNSIVKIWLIIFCQVPTVSAQTCISLISQPISETRLPILLKGIRYDFFFFFLIKYFKYIIMQFFLFIII
jgi:hypothetical protein